MGKPGFPTPPPRRGMGKPGFPMPPPAGGVGGRSPPRNNRMFIGRGAARAAWTAEVTIVRRVQPPSQPPPAGGRSRVPAPSGGGSGRGRSPCPRSRGAGGTPALPGHVHGALCAMRMTVSREPTPSARGVGKPGFPTPLPAGGSGRVQPSSMGMGKPDFPIPPPAGAVWAGAARPETSFFHPVGSHSIRRGRYWTASARWAGPICSAPARSAMVRASLMTRW